MASRVPYFRQHVCLNVVVVGDNLVRQQSRARRTRSMRLDGGREGLQSPVSCSAGSIRIPPVRRLHSPLLTEIDRHCQYSLGGNFDKVLCFPSPPFSRLAYFSLCLHFFKFVLCKELLVAGGSQGQVGVQGGSTLVQSGSCSVKEATNTHSILLTYKRAS